MTRHITKVQRTAAKKAASLGVPLAIVDVHKDEPEYVKLGSLRSFLFNHHLTMSAVVGRVYPDVIP